MNTVFVEPIGAELRARAERHRPRYPDAVAAEVRRLHREQHLTARDLAVAMRLDLAFVESVLAAR